MTRIDYQRFYDMPHYSFTEENKNGVPRRAVDISDLVTIADGVLIVSPELNFSIPGTLKNGIDWISRIKPSGFDGKHTLLAAASASPVVGVRGIHALRNTWNSLGTITMPYIVTIGGVPTAEDLTRHTQQPISDRINTAQNAFLKLLGD